MMEDKPVTDLPDLSDLPPHVQEFVRGLAEHGITVWPMKPRLSRARPEPLRANTSLTAAVLEERDEYDY